MKPPEPSFPGNTGWRPVGAPLDDGAPKLDDVLQGKVGDCLCMAIQGAIPQSVRKMITENPNGTLTGRFPDGSRVTVTPALPVNGARVGDASWPAVMEKMLAERYGGYDKLGSGTMNPRVFRDLTGREMRPLTSSRSVLRDVEDGMAEGHSYVLLTTEYFTKADRLERGLINNHYYVVTSASRKQRALKLANPWGPGTPRPELSKDEFRKGLEKGVGNPRGTNSGGLYLFQIDPP